MKKAVTASITVTAFLLSFSDYLAENTVSSTGS